MVHHMAELVLNAVAAGVLCAASLVEDVGARSGLGVEVQVEKVCQIIIWNNMCDKSSVRSFDELCSHESYNHSV